jgi:hypothetical protein
MAEVKGISELAFRSSIETIADIIGTNGKNSILRYAGIESLIDDPPAYNLEAIVTPNSIVTRFFKAVRDIMGNKGYDMIMFRAGVDTIRIAVEHVPEFQALLAMDIDPKEKLRLAYFGYVTSTKDDPDTTIEFHLEEDFVIGHFPECNECWDIVAEGTGLSAFKAPSCGFVRGLMHGVAAILKEVKDVTTKEETCRLTGGDECRFRITFQLR